MRAALRRGAPDAAVQACRESETRCVTDTQYTTFCDARPASPCHCRRCTFRSPLAASRSADLVVRQGHEPRTLQRWLPTAPLSSFFVTLSDPCASTCRRRACARWRASSAPLLMHLSVRLSACLFGPHCVIRMTAPHLPTPRPHY